MDPPISAAEWIMYPKAKHFGFLKKLAAPVLDNVSLHLRVAKSCQYCCWMAMNLKSGRNCFGRLMEFIHDHQCKTGVRPLSARAMGRELEISHTHVSNLLKNGLKRKVLKLRKGGYAYERIPVETDFWGMRWLPLVNCWWSRPIIWEEPEGGEGEYLPITLLALPERSTCFIVMFPQEEPDTGGFPPHLDIENIAIARPLRDPSDAKMNQFCLVTHGGRVSSMYRVAGNKFFQFRGFRKPALEVPVKEADHVAVIHTVIQKRLPRQNARQRCATETVSMLVKSSHFKNQDWDDTTITVRVDALRRMRGVPHQLKLTGLEETGAALAKFEPVPTKNSAADRRPDRGARAEGRAGTFDKRQRSLNILPKSQERGVKKNRRRH